MRRVLLLLLLVALPARADDEEEEDAPPRLSEAEEHKAIRYAYSAMICGKQSVINGCRQQIKKLLRAVRVGSFEGRQVYTGSRQEGIEYIQTEVLEPALKLQRHYTEVLASHKLTPLRCGTAEQKIITLCIRGAIVPECERPLMARIVDIVNNTHQSEASGD